MEMIINNIVKKFARNSFKVSKGYQIDEVSKIVMRFFSEQRKRYWKSLKTEPNKGLLLVGPKGIGKTVAFQIICRVISVDPNFNERPRLISVKEIQSIYKREQEEGRGEEFIQDLANTKILVIDDIGNEDVNFMDFGTKKNLISDILFLRYPLFQRGLVTTHATSNLPHDYLAKIYDPRLIDRMKEMFVLQIVRGDSKRSNPIKEEVKEQVKEELTEIEKRMIYLEHYKSTISLGIQNDFKGIMFEFLTNNNLLEGIEPDMELIKREQIKKQNMFIDLSPTEEEDLKKYSIMRKFFEANTDFDFNKYKVL